MTFRARLSIAFVVAAAVPLAMLALGARREVGGRLVAQYEKRVQAQVRVAEQDLVREGRTITLALATLSQALAEDDRFRLAAVRELPAARLYLLDYAERAMKLAGLEMLQLQDDDGRIISSGHFRNEFDRLEPELPRLLASAGDRATLLRARSPQGQFLVLARVDSFRVGGRGFHIVGGVRVGADFLARFSRGEDQRVSLDLGSGIGNDHGTSPDTAAASIPMQYIDPEAGDAGAIVPAQLVIAQPLTELVALRRDLNRWVVAALAAVLLGAFVLALWLSIRISRPLAELAQATARIDLDGAQVAFAASRDDEVGALARRLAAMSQRLRASAVSLRDAERRVTVGEMARQVNHDIKNGLIPIRNVLRHFGEVQSQRPEELSAVFAERRGTLESSLEYLDTLARNYARLTPRMEHGPIDVNAVVREAAAAGAAESVVQAKLAPGLPPIFGDPIVLRRIVDNLLRNAIESLGDGAGRVTISTARSRRDSVVVCVSDTGRGMTEQALARAFEDFFTTKSGGTGLGLSVVRRLTTDLHGSVRVESAPGKGTTFTLEFPISSPVGTGANR